MSEIVSMPTSSDRYVVPASIRRSLFSDADFEKPYFTDVVWCIKDADGNMIAMDLNGEYDARTKCCPGEEYGVIVKKTGDYVRTGPESALVRP